MANRIIPTPIKRETATAEERRADKIAMGAIESLTPLSVNRTMAASKSFRSIAKKVDRFKALAEREGDYSDEALLGLIKDDKQRIVQNGLRSASLALQIGHCMRVANCDQERNKQAVSEWNESANILVGPCVYIIQGAGIFKIGQTMNLESRMVSHRGSSPVPLRLLRAIVCEGSESAHIVIERVLHAQFSSKRKHGEWFALDPEDLDYIDSSCRPWLAILGEPEGQDYD